MSIWSNNNKAYNNRLTLNCWMAKAHIQRTKIALEMPALGIDQGHRVWHARSKPCHYIILRGEKTTVTTCDNVFSPPTILPSLRQLVTERMTWPTLNIWAGLGMVVPSSCDCSCKLIFRVWLCGWVVWIKAICFQYVIFQYIINIIMIYVDILPYIFCSFL